MDVIVSVALGFGVWVVVACACGLGWWALRQRVVLSQRVIVNLADGSGIEGVLVKHDGKTLVLEQASLVGETTKPISLDGTIFIDRTNVHFVQGL